MGGLCPGGSLSGGLCSGSSLFRGSLSRGISVRETPRQRSLYGEERAVHILLECILVFILHLDDEEVRIN